MAFLRPTLSYLASEYQHYIRRGSGFVRPPPAVTVASLLQQNCAYGHSKKLSLTLSTFATSNIPHPYETLNRREGPGSPVMETRTLEDISTYTGEPRLDISSSKNLVCPPTRKGMQILNKQAFEKEISVPTVLIPEDRLKSVLPKLKPFLLKIKKLQNVISNEGEKTKRILLDPEKVNNAIEFVKTVPDIHNDEEILTAAPNEMVKLTYEHWSVSQLMEAILPDEHEKFSSFSLTGHVAHVNLREHLRPFRQLIGQILLDKVPGCKTVVNKLNEIESEFRTFQMEVIAGESSTVVQLRENKCYFEFDFATVYWNSRLSAEHEKVVKFLKPDFIVFDVFAGVGPFAIPAAKKRCFVYANDLNPDCKKWLEHNVCKNKVTNFVQVYNKDGRQFLSNDVQKIIKQRLSDNEEIRRQVEYHVIMNLPAIAVTFLDTFWNLLGSYESTGEENLQDIPTDFQLIVHVYCFVKATEGFKEKALALVNRNLSYELDDKDLIEVSVVRNVAPNKEMLRVSFVVPHQILRSENPLSCNKSSILKRKYSDIDVE